MELTDCTLQNKKKISELEDTATETTQNKTQRNRLNIQRAKQRLPEGRELREQEKQVKGIKRYKIPLRK